MAMCPITFVLGRNAYLAITVPNTVKIPMVYLPTATGESNQSPSNCRSRFCVGILEHLLVNAVLDTLPKRHFKVLEVIL